MWAPQPFIMDKDEDQPVDKEQAKYDNAIDALTNFVSSYSPATDHTADTFFSTKEIRNAIGELTGFILDPSDIYDLMIKMKYSYQAAGLEFNWLLKKE